MAQTLDDALLAARMAVQFDGKGQYKPALYYYDLAVKLLARLQLDDTYEEKLSDYRDRISTIQQLSKLSNDESFLNLRNANDITTENGNL